MFSPLSFCRTLATTAIVSQVTLANGASAPDSKERQITRGRLLYLQHCVACHQSQGQGTAGAFPPLAKSDFLFRETERVLRFITEGSSGAATVNGITYNGFMPPAVLTDQQVADVLTFVRNSWGNSGDAVTPDQVKEVRAKTQFPTFEALSKANAYAPLPKAPEGFTLREVVRLQNHPSRLVSDGQGKVLYVLCVNGDVWRVDLSSKSLRQVLWGAQYIDLSRGDPVVQGAALDSRQRLYIVANQRNESVTPVNAEVTIFRTTAVRNGDPADPKPWFKSSYPWGTGNHHGVGHAAFGPDGMLYVTSGSRTDSNEPGTDPRIAKIGETPLTACLWRLDPNSEKPEIEIYARGLRNMWGFCWTEQGEMFGTENGPNADAPEELNLIERGKHYGFPYQFSDWTKKPYPHTPDPPSKIDFTLPIANLGPDAALTAQPIYTFDPHSSPSGIVYLGNDFPEPHRDTFLVGRFGILIDQPKDYGFDLLQVRLRKNAAGRYEASIKNILAPLARPVDVHRSGKGKIYICEYCRATTSKGSLGLPGRILELSVKE